MRFLSIALLVLLVSCQIKVEQPVAAPPKTERPDASQRPPTVPHLRVRNQAFGRSKERLAFGIKELKRLGFWHELTDHLFVLKLGSRLGLDDVPEDEHLADASSTGIVEDDDIGALCDLMFFSTAIRKDLERVRGYYAQGLVEETPPSLGHYWVIILGHELTHCLPQGHGEKAARATEKRIRAEYEARGETP
ncbi:MAG: hypothetical protein QOH26_1606 [Actinomycetota bacterium]|nr:hypothetical protein [Actinomycetota bacterium]